MILFEVCKLGKEVDHRRYHDGVGNLLISDDFTESLSIEPWQCNLAGAKRRRGEHRRKIGDMKDGGDMKINTAFAITHPIIKVMDVRKHIGVSQHHPFWPACRAARIDKSQNRIRVV